MVTDWSSALRPMKVRLRGGPNDGDIVTVDHQLVGVYTTPNGEKYYYNANRNLGKLREFNWREDG